MLILSFQTEKWNYFNTQLLFYQSTFGDFQLGGNKVLAAPTSPLHIFHIWRIPKRVGHNRRPGSIQHMCWWGGRGRFLWLWFPGVGQFESKVSFNRGHLCSTRTESKQSAAVWAPPGADERALLTELLQQTPIPTFRSIGPFRKTRQLIISKVHPPHVKEAEWKWPL